MSLKILHINFNDSGGAAVASMDLHEELLRQGIHSRYLCLNLTKKHSADRHYYTHRRIYTSFFRKLWHLYIKAAWVNCKYRNMETQIPEPNDAITLPYSSFDVTLDPLYKEADIIHLHWTGRFLDWPSFFRKNRKPIVWTLHDRNPFSGILHCAADFPSAGEVLNTKIALKKACWLKKQRIWVVGPSEQYTEFSLKSNVLGQFPHCTIHHGIPEFYFHPVDRYKCKEKHDLPHDRKIVLSVASDLKRKLKGFSDLIDFAKTRSELFFLFIGKKDPTAPDLSNVRYTGSIEDRSVLNELYNSADLTISNSKEESFGLTIAESLMAGTPVSGRKIGLLRSLSDSQCFQELENIPMINVKRKTESCTEIGRSHFDLIIQTKKYLTLYASVK
jgi:glycosyltransferase involved in cell wall biosynthesis